MTSPIAKLTPEILLKIFECITQDTNATLIAPALCCKKWHPLAQSVLYGDVFLNMHRLSKFLANSAEHGIRSLTVSMCGIPTYDSALAAQTAEAQLETLQQLCPRIKTMGLRSLSISVDLPLPYTASWEISSIVNSLPASCTSLEIDTRHSSFISAATRNLCDRQTSSHICDAIRTVLPRLEHLRLRRPQICSAVFCTETHAENERSQAASAPKLKTCIINLSLRSPGPWPEGLLSTVCGKDPSRVPHIGTLIHFPSALPPMLPGLQDFARDNSTRLERLWVIDAQPQEWTMPHSWAAWIRRDILSSTSVPIPLANIGGFPYRDDSWMARVPTEQWRARDWASSPSPDLLEALAEGNTWSETATGVRLATPMLRGCERVPRAFTRAQFTTVSGMSCTLWINEERTGESLLPKGPGPLMKKWDLNERTPSGWTRDDRPDSPMIRA